jgi:hypothetical protein
LIARHLDSIGTAEARSKASNRVAGGETKFISRLGGSANVDGQAMVVSSGAKLRFGITGLKAKSLIAADATSAAIRLKLFQTFNS